MDDLDEDDSPLSNTLLMAVPAEQRRAFLQLREMAALKGIHLSPSSTDDGMVGFVLEHRGLRERCASLSDLKAELVRHGVPLLSDEELQRLLRAFQAAFTRQMEGEPGVRQDH